MPDDVFKIRYIDRVPAFLLRWLLDQAWDNTADWDDEDEENYYQAKNILDAIVPQEKEGS